MKSVVEKEAAALNRSFRSESEKVRERSERKSQAASAYSKCCTAEICGRLTELPSICFVYAVPWRNR